jgi:hypothetical protein
MPCDNFLIATANFTATRIFYLAIAGTKSTPCTQTACATPE